MQRYTVVPNPDEQQVADLEAVVKLLDKWQRTGKTPKYPGST